MKEQVTIRYFAAYEILPKLNIIGNIALQIYISHSGHIKQQMLKLILFLQW